MKLLLAVLLAGAAGGCAAFSSVQPSSPPLYAIEVAGIVVSIETARPGTRYELTNGRIVSTDATTRHPGTRGPSQGGDLLLWGTQPTAWLFGLRALNPVPVPAPAACYVVTGETRTTSTHVLVLVHDALLGDGLIAFKKAPEWEDVDHFKVEGSDVLLGVFNCINERGEITEHRFGQ